MPKTLLSPFDHVQDILASRNRTHSGKFQAVPAGTELVKDIVASSCAAVAEAFVADGFRWAKSGLRFSRKVGPFTHSVFFRADGANTSGHYVAVTMYAQVKSSALKKWRTANNGATDSVTSGSGKSATSLLRTTTSSGSCMIRPAGQTKSIT